jgi:hypothetical protein
MRIFKTIAILIIWGLLFSSFSFAQNQTTSPPKILGGKAKEEVGEIQTKLGGTIKEEVLVIWRPMYDWFKENIWLKIERLLKEIQPRAKKETEKRKLIIKEEFKKEKKETKEELPKIINSLWENLKELIK